MSYYLDKLEEIGEEAFVKDIRTLLPSKAKERIKLELSNNSKQHQALLNAQRANLLIRSTRTSLDYENKGRILKGLLKEIEGK